MKRVGILILLWCGVAAGQQTTANITPASTGQNLGSVNQRWNAFIQNLDVSGTMTLSGPLTISPSAFSQLLSGNNGWTGNQTFGGLTTLNGEVVETRARVVRTGLLAEYNFSDGTGTTLTDISGNGQNGTLSGASWITGGGVSCNGTSSTIPLPASLSANAKAVVIFQKYGPFQTLQQPSQLVPSVLASSDANGIFLKESYKVLDANTSSAKMNGAPALMQGGATVAGTLEPMIGYHMITANLTTPQASFFIDDTAPGSYYINTGVTLPPAGNYQFCGSSAMSGSFWTGNIYYAAFYDHALSSTEVTQNYRAVRDYLLVHGVNMAPPRASWGKASRLMAIGDSITENNYLQYMGTLDDPSNEGWALTNDGVSGSWTFDVQANIPWREATQVVSNGARCAAVIAAHTNNINGGMTVGDTFASWMSMVRTAKQTLPPACKVIVATMIDRTGFDTQKNSIDALIRARFSEVADWLTDWAGDPNLGCDGCSTNATYFQQTGEPGVHPTLPTGQTLLGNLVTNAVNAAFGPKDVNAAGAATTTATYTEVAHDTFLNVDPTSNSQTITVPDATGYAGTMRCIRNVAVTSLNTVTVVPGVANQLDPSGQASVTIPNSTTTCFVGRVTNASTPFTIWQRQTSGTVQSPFYGSALTPRDAGGATLGDGTHPWSGIQIGTSTTVRSNITTTATSARAVSLPDAGGTLAIIPAATTTGRAACIKGTGQIGYCSTQPDATGACTCN